MMSGHKGRVDRLAAYLKTSYSTHKGLLYRAGAKPTPPPPLAISIACDSVKYTLQLPARMGSDQLEIVLGIAVDSMSISGI